jgi:pimeloyl-ACP methyl ester carboxylesterase
MMKGMINIFFILLISASVCGQSANPGIAETSTIPYGNNPAVGKYYNVRGIKIYAEEYGKGMPLLMIHGNGGSGKSFEKIIPFFSKNYRVIIADSRAQGKSVDTGDSLSFEMIADDKAALLDAMHIDSAYILGTSDGGIVALVLALRHPDKVIKLAETGADLVPDSTGIAIVHSSWLKSKKFFDENKNKIFNNEAEKNRWKVKILDWRQPDIPFSALQSIRCPALIISGDHDMFKVEHALQIYHHIPKAYLWVIPNSGHGTMREHTDDFIKKVDHFFKEPYKDRENYIL